MLSDWTRIRSWVKPRCFVFWHTVTFYQVIVFIQCAKEVISHLLRCLLTNKHEKVYISIDHRHNRFSDKIWQSHFNINNNYFEQFVNEICPHLATYAVVWQARFFSLYVHIHVVTCLHEFRCTYFCTYLFVCVCVFACFYW